MKTILVAEDEFDMLNVIRAILEEEGFRVLAASNGRDALDLARKNTPDLVITDVMMPYMSGYELVQKINEAPELANVHSILMSAVRINPPVKPKNAAFLKKPFSIEDLLKAVTENVK